MRYFFNIRDGETFIADPEGSDLGSLEAAIDEAKANAREMIAERLRTGAALRDQVFELTNDSGDIVARIDFKDVLH